ncbi:uncharacterized protein LOC110118936 [Ceratitis capitata]|uniref:uncharacterized protein LOC110118936 n=1 Tax=Ceratitis capitata TaxID=7213 RepID=UPI000A113A5C|nr:uncharacterized protein LOC110118936 [Ceratitis capitata]
MNLSHCECSCRTLIQKLVEKMELLAQVSDVKNKTSRSRTNENIGVVAKSLELDDHQQRRVFTAWVLEVHENVAEFHRNIFLTDESHFHLNGDVNKQNCRICGTGNSRLNPQTVWCGL